MPIEYSGISAVELKCKNYDETVKFYAKKMNFDVIQKGADFTTLQIGQQKIILLDAPYSSQNKTALRSYHHICLESDNIFDAARDLLGRDVVVYAGLPDSGRLCPEPPAQQPLGQCNSYCFFVRDPEGNDIEIQQFTENSLQLS